MDALRRACGGQRILTLACRSPMVDRWADREARKIDGGHPESMAQPPAVPKHNGSIPKQLKIGTVDVATGRRVRPRCRLLGNPSRWRPPTATAVCVLLAIAGTAFVKGSKPDHVPVAAEYGQIHHQVRSAAWTRLSQGFLMDWGCTQTERRSHRNETETNDLCLDYAHERTKKLRTTYIRLVVMTPMESETHGYRTGPSGCRREGRES